MSSTRILRRLRLGPRLALAFCALVASAVAVTALGVVALERVEGELSRLVGDKMPKVALARDVRELIANNGMLARELPLQTDAARRRTTAEAMRSNTSAIGRKVGELGRLVASEAGRRLLGSVNAADAAYLPTLEEAVRLGLAGDRDGAHEHIVASMGPRQAALLDALAALVDHQQASATATVSDTARLVGVVQTSMLAITATAAVLGALLAWAVTRSITRPLHRAVDATRSIAQGDLTSTIDMVGGDEVAHLLRALDTMRASLARVVGTVRGNADGVAVASSQIAAGNQDLSRRTERQAGALQRTAASMDDLEQAAKRNAENAAQANRLSRQASAVASRGGQIVGDVVATMRSINDASRHIADIVAVIDGIALQINILAINAAVEAARAGPQGRGFAVVAGEVRMLAQRSAGAAKEIKGLIATSVEQVDAGTALVDQAGATMEEIVGAVRRVSDIMDEISDASRDQSAGVSRIGGAVVEMDHATQQNSALVEQSAAAAESLRVQAGRLVDTVSVFRLAGRAASALP